MGGKRVLVTGGSGDIGSATVRAFAEEGCDVAFTFHSGASRAEELVSELSQSGLTPLALQMDLTDSSSVRMAVEDAAQRMGGLDVLVSNAVVWDEWRQGIEAWGAEDWIPFLRGNIEGVFALVQAAAPFLRRSAQGRIAFVSSTLSERGMSGVWCYTTAKAAGHGLAKSLAWDLGRDGILVNSVLPGIVLNVNGSHRNIPQDEIAKLEEASATGRLPRTTDVADLILFLCSSCNASITGESIRITAGAE